MHHNFHPVSVSVRVFRLEAPQGVLLNAKTEIVCYFDLENDTLYTLNWFLNGVEIASLRPSKQSVIEFFPLPYLDLDLNQSFSNKLIINGFKTSGLYHVSCEVTVHDSFQLQSAQSDIRVIGLYFFTTHQTFYYQSYFGLLFEFTRPF